MRDAVGDLLDADPATSKFERYYVRPEMLPFLTPREVELMRLDATLERRRDAAKQAVAR